MLQRKVVLILLNVTLLLLFYALAICFRPTSDYRLFHLVQWSILLQPNVKGIRYCVPVDSKRGNVAEPCSATVVRRRYFLGIGTEPIL